MKNNRTLKHVIETALQGLFGLLPIVITVVVILWLYRKIDQLVGWVFEMVGFIPQNHQFLWTLVVLILFGVLLYFMGHLVQTRTGSLIQNLMGKIPGYKTIKDMINIFNSSKKGEHRVLVVAIKGFTMEGYNIGLMYSQKESIIKGHYTVTLSMSPIPNGGFMFEVPQENIYVIEDATFDDNLQYLLSMGVKSLTEVLKTEPHAIDNFTPLTKWIERSKKHQE
ncbi:MAG TPA: DUF502 domain-containing protein [Epsilonproteobacteria bacterium]|nr:DUF502 domain-containing protein [Campylobacterota bacterium]